jgi:hypothetical protein
MTVSLLVSLLVYRDVVVNLIVGVARRSRVTPETG